MKTPILLIRSRLIDKNVYFDAIDLINYLATESNVEKVKNRLVEIHNDVCGNNGINTYEK